MLDKPSDEHALYWLELLLSMGIATFGLVLDSVGVIGAMLIAPLMTPIIELSMSLVIASAYLLVKSLARVVVSVTAVCLGAAIITVVLPFRVATPEILARTSPTLLDLFVAIFCAVAAAAITARPHAGATSTAAGTAIGISLVPPLCVAGFGIGSGDREIAEGAFLLFTANFCAILAFAAVAFWLMDFAPDLEGSAADRAPDGPIDARYLDVARSIESHFGARSRTLVRVLVPAAMLTVIVQPLSHALAKVSDEVRARIAAREPLLAEAIRLEPIVDRGGLEVRAVVVGSDREAAELQTRLATALAAATGADPVVHVRAVQQASLADRARDPSARTAGSIDDISPSAAARALERAVTSALAAQLPRMDDVIDSRIDVTAGGGLHVTLAFAGDALDTRTSAILARSLAGPLGTDVEVTAVSLPGVPLTAPVGDGVAWLEDASRSLLAARPLPGVAVCLTLPPTAILRQSADADTRARVIGLVADLPADRVSVEDGSSWGVRFARTSCGARPSVPETTGRPGQ
jgi:uncharacterized hydrophobic protein (TIGR00271 family)